jgi:hypothetical protein
LQKKELTFNTNRSLVWFDTVPKSEWNVQDFKQKSKRVAKQSTNRQENQSFGVPARNYGAVRGSFKSGFAEQRL